MNDNELRQVPPSEYIPVTEYVGKLNIGGYEIPCAVLLKKLYLVKFF